MLESKWDWHKERDSIVIRVDDLDVNGASEYVAEIDTRYLHVDELKVMEAVASEIVLLHNVFIKTKGELKKLLGE